MRSLILTLSAVGLCSCASSLKVWQGDTTVSGIPFRSSEAYVKTGVHNRHSEQGENCTPTEFTTTISLGTGELYYVNLKPAQLAKSGFSVKLTDSGTLAEVGMNTEPAASETVKATGETLASLLPFAGIIPKAAPGPESAAALPAPRAASPPACDAGEVRVKFIPLAEWRASQR